MLRNTQQLEVSLGESWGLLSEGLSHRRRSGSPGFTGLQRLPSEVALFHNADVPGSSPGV